MPSLVFSKRGKTDFNIPDKLSVPASGCQVGSLVPIALSTALLNILFRIFYSFPVMLSLIRQPISLSVVQHGVCHSNMQSEVQG